MNCTLCFTETNGPGAFLKLWGDVGLCYSYLVLLLSVVILSVMCNPISSFSDTVAPIL